MQEPVFKDCYKIVHSYCPSKLLDYSRLNELVFVKTGRKIKFVEHGELSLKYQWRFQVILPCRKLHNWADAQIR